MFNIVGIVSYVGTAYLGWQKTRMGSSIQEELEKALTILLCQPTSVEAASRTDAGVHARGQVINFFVDEKRDLPLLKYGLNSLLPRDIVVTSLRESHPSFHPTLDAKAKEYHYEVAFGSTQSPFLRHFTWHVPHQLDLAKMEKAAQTLLGEHDFSSFCNGRALFDIDPVCHIYRLTIELLSPGHLRIAAQGNRFLYRMMRNLAGTLVNVGEGKLPVEAMKTILDAKNRTLAGATAPPQGLFLHEVAYDLS